MFDTLKVLMSDIYRNHQINPQVFAVYIALDCPSILRKLGFSLVGEVVHPEDGNIWQWRLTNSEA